MEGVRGREEAVVLFPLKRTGNMSTYTTVCVL